MARFIELTAEGSSDTKLLFNVEHIVSVAPDQFNSITKIMVPGMMFSVKESYFDVQQLLNPN